MKRMKRGDEALDRLVAEWKRIPGERLSEGARKHILREAIQAQESSPVPTGVRIAAWRVLAGALPFAAVVLVALLFASHTADRDGSPVRLRATKQGSEVVFSIVNGARSHSVYKSHAPNRFDPSARLPVRGGSFRDSVDDATGLVFYRID